MAGQRSWRVGLAAVLAAAASVAARQGAGGGQDDRRGNGAVFTSTNEADGNRLVVYWRTPNGQLMQAAAVATGGTGTGAGLGNQGAIAIGHGRMLYVVNAGSDTISVFRVTRRGAALIQTVASGGERPISVAVSGDLLYVLNAGGLEGQTDNVTGFAIGRQGMLEPIPDSTRPLSAASTDPAQVGFTPDGDVLVVTEKMTNTITTFVVNDDGTLSTPMPQTSEGETPFGFSFNNEGHLIVSEAFGGAPDASATSSYEVGDDGLLVTISASVPTTETAACWVAVTASGRFAYTTNTGSGSVSGYFVDPGTGRLVLLTPDGRTADTGAGSAPVDADTVGSRFLYVLESGSGNVSGYMIHPRNGRLAPLTEVNGLPMSSTGLIAW